MTDIADDFTTGARLDPARPIESDLEHYSDIDAVAVDLVAGQRYTFDLLGLDAGGGLTLRDPMLWLFSGDGNILTQDDDGGDGLNSRIEFVAEASGTYYLAASGLGSIGTYRMTMSLNGVTVDDFAADASTAGRVTIGGITGGRVDHVGDEDWFAVSLTAGTSYAFRLAGQTSGQGTLADPLLHLYDAAGALVAAAGDAADADTLIRFTPATSGTYYLGAASHDPALLGSYSLSAASGPADLPFSAATPATLTAGTTLESTIDDNRDIDAIRIDLVAGERYVFDLAGTSAGLTLASPTIAILDSGFSALAEASGGGVTSLAFEAPADGAYYLAVLAADGGTGSYRVTMRLSDDTLIGGPGADHLEGRGGNDILVGGGGDDWLDGGSGDDRLLPGTGNDRVDGGAGSDTVVLDGAASDYTALRVQDGWRLLSPFGEKIVLNVEAVEVGGRVIAMADFAAAAFDGMRYIASSPDLIQAFSTDVATARQHYETIGHLDGHALASFDPFIYAAANLDVAAAYGMNATAISRHYVEYGYAEGRSTTGFDPLLYLAGNPDLYGPLGTDKAALTLHYLANGRAEGRPTHAFDSSMYLASNADVLLAFGNDRSAAIAHYVNYGIAEGRPTAGFDLWRYAASNPDVALATHGDAGAILNHYLNYGVREGRATASFDAIEYAASNPDVARAYGVDMSRLAQHYAEYGVVEGRATHSFDALLYGASHADLASHYGADEAGLARHYVEYGLAESRATGGFDAVAYLLTNADLGAVGLGADGALRHWLSNGVAEGRTGDATFGREQLAHDLVVGGSAHAAIERAGDRDWFGLSLHAGETVTLDLHGTGLSDPLLSLFDAAGRQVAVAADAGSGSDAILRFTAGGGGTYYVVAASGQAGDTGGYALSAASDWGMI